jgi:hypothetical protein
MPDQPIHKKHGNLFARELEGILVRYNLSLSQLEDRAGIRREKVQRLLQSLQKPNMFPILNVSEMEMVRVRVGLDPWDLVHLRAAMLATSIEKTLMVSMQPDEALLVAEQTFPIILIALQKQSGRLRGTSATRGDPDSSPAEDDEIAGFFDNIWQIIDEAEMELQLSSNVYAHPLRVEYARSALAHFTDGHTRLVAAARRMQNFQLWQGCEAACQQGLAAANKHLEELGE